MILLPTVRLELIALSYEQLLLLSEGRNVLERDMGLALSDFELNAPAGFLQEFEEVIPGYVIPRVRANPGSYAWYSHWLIVERSSRLTIGGVGANGLPNAEGEAMIGYFIDKKSEGRGYASEAVACFTDWIFMNSSATRIVADTLTDGLASQRVLKKAGFEFAGDVEEGLRWERKRSGFKAE